MPRHAICAGKWGWLPQLLPGSEQWIRVRAASNIDSGLDNPLSGKLLTEEVLDTGH